MKLSSIQGYETIFELIPDGNLLKYTRVWSAHYSQVLATDGVFTNGIFILMADDDQSPKKDMIELCCLSPEIVIWPSRQIVGLNIEFQDMAKTHGWERGYYEIYDYENNDVRIRCQSIVFNRVKLIEALNMYREWV